jgi:hypothetical protein
MKSRLPIHDRGVWLGSGVGWVFVRPNLAELVGRTGPLVAMDAGRSHNSVGAAPQNFIQQRPVGTLRVRFRFEPQQQTTRDLAP